MSTEKNVIIKNFARRIKAFRNEHDLTIQQLADLTGVPYTTARQAENGTHVGYSFVIGIAEKFPNDLHYLLTGERPKERVVSEEECALLDWYGNAHHFDKDAVQSLIKRDAEQKGHSAGGKPVREKKPKPDGK